MNVQTSITLVPARFDFQAEMLADHGMTLDQMAPLTVEGHPTVVAWCEAEGPKMFRSCYAYDGLWYVRARMVPKPKLAERAFQMMYAALADLK
jgi:hypothetical protein